MRALELLARELDALADLARALRRALAQAPLELVHVGRDEDRDAALDLRLHSEGAFELELEDADLVVGRDAVDLRAQRAVPVPGDVLDPLEELVRLDPARELLVGEKPVVVSVGLARALRARRRGDGDLQAGDALDEALDQRPLPRSRRARYDEDGPRGT